MSDFDIGLVSLAVMVFLVYGGLWMPFALMLTSYLGVWAIKGTPLLAGKMLALSASDAIANYYFGVIPLFVLMGYIVSATGMATDAFDIANQAFRKIKGGLGLGTVGANAIFAAITGISIASAAVFTKVAVPEMVKHGYTKRFSVGLVAGSSVLGMLIPPSLLLILYGIITEQSIGDLFLAGILPGILLAVMFGVGIILMAMFTPKLVGSHLSKLEQNELLPMSELVKKGFPIVALISIVLGGIYGGLFTPTEAGAVGALGAIVIGLLKKKLNWTNFWQVLKETGTVTASISFLILGAQMYSRMLSLSELPVGLGTLIAHADIGLMGILLAYIVLIILMGTILDAASIMLILVPLMLPILAGMDVNLIWFGIITIIGVEIGLLTPPFGVSVFVIKSALNDDSMPIGQIFLGAAPFVLMMLATLGLILIFPSIATILI